MKDIDKGFKDIIKKLQALKGKTLKAGILSDAGVNKKTGALIADYASINEFGGYTEDGVKIPERSFIRSTCNEQSKKWEAMKDKIVDKIIDDPSSNVERLIGLLGEQVVGDIKEKILSNVPPELSDYTKARKGSTRSLVDTNNMLNSIDFEIVDK